MPDFSAYRRDDVKDTRAKAGESAPTRSAFTYMLVGGEAIQGHVLCLSLFFLKEDFVSMPNVLQQLVYSIKMKLIDHCGSLSSIELV